MSAIFTETQIATMISQYLDNDNTELSQPVVETIKIFARTRFYRQDKESLRRSKENFNSRVIAGEYDSGDEMHGPNNFNKGLGPKYITVNMYYDSSHFPTFVNSYPKIWKHMIMIVLSSEAFKILCDNEENDYEEDKCWFIENLTRVIYSFIRE
jgi:hypothetical protein